MKRLNTDNALVAGLTVGKQLRDKGNLPGCCLWMALCAAYVLREQDNQTTALPA